MIDHKLQEEYLGESHLMILSNQARFNNEAYGDESIVKESRIFDQIVNHRSPSWIRASVMKN